MWQFDRGLKAAVAVGGGTTTVDLSLDGKMLWALQVGAKSKLHCYDTVNGILNSTNSDDIMVERSTEFLGASVQQTLDYFGSNICAFQDHAYVSFSSTNTFFTDSFDSLNVYDVKGSKVDTIKLPDVMRSNIIAHNNKLWMCGAYVNNSYQQVLFSYDLITKTFASSVIPTRHQNVRRFLAKDYNGFILISDFNNLSVSKFTNTGTYVSTTRTAAASGGANRQPDSITVDQNRNVYVSSYNGMILKFDSLTDTFTHFSTGLGDVHAFADDGTYQWIGSKKKASSVSFNEVNYTCTVSHIAVGTKPDAEKWALGGDGSDGVWTAANYYVDDKEDLLRINKADQSMRHFSTSERDIGMDDPVGAIKDMMVNKVLISPSITCSTATGDRVVPSYVWLTTAAGYVVGLPTGPMFRQNFYEMNGVAMTSVGNYDYTGD